MNTIVSLSCKKSMYLVEIVSYMYLKLGNSVSNSFLLLFSNKKLVIRAEIHKMLVKITNGEDTDQMFQIWVFTICQSLLSS